MKTETKSSQVVLVPPPPPPPLLDRNALVSPEEKSTPKPEAPVADTRYTGQVKNTTPSAYT